MQRSWTHCPLGHFVVYCRRSASHKVEGGEKENMGQLLLSLAQLIIAVILSAVAAYLAFYLFQWFTRDLDEWEELRRANAAVGIVLGAILIAVAIVLRPALSVNTTAWDVGGSLFFRVLLAEALQLALGLVLAVVTLALALYLFAGLTRGIDEVEELKKGNLAIAGLLAGVVIAVGLMVSQAIGQIMALVSSVLF
jgi:uncharacterized membrane protein YjfL (UPF0719 family)